MIKLPSRPPHLLTGARRLHEHQRGAIAILAMAGALILLLASWIVYDAGASAQKKMDAQIAADTAALSQATVKARSMNLLAYANVTKRSVWGIHSLYPSYMYAVAQWIHGNYTIAGVSLSGISSMNAVCEDCYEDSDNEDCNLCNFMNNNRQTWKAAACKYSESDTACDADDPDTWGDFYRFTGHDHNIYPHELMKTDAGADYPKLAEDDLAFKMIIGDTLGSPQRYTFRVGEDPSWSTRFFGKDLMAMDNYQRYIFAITPWWGWTEQAMRAMRNGATLSGSFPAPPGVIPESSRSITNLIINHYLDASPVTTDSSIHNHSSYMDSLPVRPGNIGSMRTHLESALSASNLINLLKNCITGSTCASENPFLLEHLINIATVIFASPETVVGFGGDGLREHLSSIAVNLLAATSSFKEQGVTFTENAATRALPGNRISAEPWELRPFATAGEWQVNTSNIVLTLLADFTAFNIAQGRKKYQILQESDYYRRDARSVTYQNHFYGESFADRPAPISADSIAEKNTYRAGSTWGMARAEIFHTGEFGPDLWTPSWTSRMRPIALGNEWNEAHYNMNEVFHDTLPYMVLSRTMGSTGYWPLDRIGVDFARMEAASHAMGNSTIGGIVK
ncbi:hypothetical protein DV096_09530 [Bradymonadaceae bacterium TMQ3]|uniref:Flp pilus-assembly TadG-like N-terminal domain-containing protein n=1 Tax=Lujinxingia sediminis TaxID=2480984 RepID=A0ABY0CQ85_9DELT|nr:Tad domain-containing protein [Lujinxingia sediminis]RDV38046.1 hypothetical protein DV096_09530 [Bradymonadaceae bacterium TMQ3]RVU42284.1 hypothetical protein EA187_17000 [Lujinxingia sediminis]TXC75717.1 hypothetical protein FRC91_09435 [Bradymonadales bacterium TMQ1]